MSEFKITGGDAKSPIRIQVSSGWMAEAMIIAGSIVVAQSDDNIRGFFGLGIIGAGLIAGVVERAFE